MPKSAHSFVGGQFLALQKACAKAVGSAWKSFVKESGLYPRSTAFKNYLTSQAFSVNKTPTALNHFYSTYPDAFSNNSSVSFNFYPLSTPLNYVIKIRN